MGISYGLLKDGNIVGASGSFSWLTGTSSIIDFPMKKTPFIEGFPMVFPLKAEIYRGFPP